MHYIISIKKLSIKIEIRIKLRKNKWNKKLRINKLHTSVDDGLEIAAAEGDGV